MKRSIFTSACLFIGIFLSATAQGKVLDHEICPGRLTIVSEKKIKFTPLEKKFLCGDPQVEAWNSIPMAQVKFHLGAFLQERGYYADQTEFREEGDRLIAILGKPLKVTDLEFLGAPEDTEMHQRRKIKGRKLTPKILNEVENWTKSRLQSRAYACPTVQSRGNVEDGRIEVDVNPGPKQDLTGIDEDPVPRLQAGVLRRFDAFELGEPYNDDFLTLTSRRVEEDGILQNTYFVPECEETPLRAEQRNFAGKPRLFTFGIGFDTQEYLILRSSWSHNMLGSKGSKYKANFYASYRRQTIENSLDWYLFKPGSRWYLQPLVSFDHELQPSYHFLSANAGVAAAGSLDTQNLGFTWRMGPNLNYVYTFSGAQPGLTRFVALQFDWQMMSHYYEFYRNDPRTGFYLHLNGDLTNKNLLSELSAERFQWDGQYLYNLLGKDPPLLILGVRGRLAGTWVKYTFDNLQKLPPNYRYYLGGTDDLRGFSLDELPRGDGALTSASMSFEVRAGNVLPLNIQPFAFIDAGILGNQALKFRAPLYYSPGFGIRYPSPFGVFRVTFAHGFKTSPDNNPNNTHFQFYFSYGEEF